jgi:hypothetical protein
LVSDSATIDGKIAYHEEMEQIAIKAGDFTKVEHHRKMQEICRAMKEAVITKGY